MLPLPRRDETTFVKRDVAGAEPSVSRRNTEERQEGGAGVSRYADEADGCIIAGIGGVTVGGGGWGGGGVDAWHTRLNR